MPLFSLFHVLHGIPYLRIRMRMRICIRIRLRIRDISTSINTTNVGKNFLSSINYQEEGDACNCESLVTKKRRFKYSGCLEVILVKEKKPSPLSRMSKCTVCGRLYLHERNLARHIVSPLPATIHMWPVAEVIQQS